MYLYRYESAILYMHLYSYKYSYMFLRILVWKRFLDKCIMLDGNDKMPNNDEEISYVHVIGSKFSLASIQVIIK